MSSKISVLALALSLACPLAVSAAVPIGPEVVVHESFTEAMQLIDVVFNGTRQVFLWHETDPAGTTVRGMYASVMEDNGDIAAGPIMLSPTGSEHAAMGVGVDITAIAWIENDAQGVSHVRLALLDAIGRLTGPATLAQTAGAQSVDVGAVSGRFVLVWSDPQKVYAGSVNLATAQLISQSAVANDSAAGIHIASNMHRMFALWDARRPCTCGDSSEWTVVRGRELDANGAPIAAAFQLDLPFTTPSVNDVDAAANADLFISVGSGSSHPSRLLRISPDGLLKARQDFPFADTVSVLWSGDQVITAFKRGPDATNSGLYLYPLTPLFEPPAGVEYEQAFTLSREGAQESNVHLSLGNSLPIAAYSRARNEQSESYAIVYRKLDLTTLPTLPDRPEALWVAAIYPRENSVDARLEWNLAGDPKFFRIEAFPTDNPNAIPLQAEAVKLDTKTLAFAGETTYRIALMVENSAGTSKWSEGVTFRTPPAQRPRAPEILTSAMNLDRKLIVSWSDKSSNEDGFRVSALQDGTSTVLATLPANTTQATVNVPPGAHMIAVSAFNAAGSNAAYVGPLDTARPMKRRAVRR